ncbi:unnamed protein product [Owenia fusiformis]|uniref:Fibrinogen C-terminal domain-containing protein n=1 Tax=Owenia fusiformis TaxID=6347 RepID=A0A8S4NIR8_OWEFU|nr:unnamed protein product [Owenia fusiformis]
MKHGLAYGFAILWLSCFSVSRAGNLEKAIQLLIEKLKIDLKEDSSSIRDVVSNLRDVVSNLRDDVSNLRDDVSNLRDDVSNLRDGQSDIRDINFILMKHLDERISGNIVINDTKADIPVISDACSKAATMFETIQDQLRSFPKKCPFDVGGNCSKAFGADTVKEDLDMLKEQMKKLADVCKTESDVEIYKEPCTNATLSISEDCFGRPDGVHIILTKRGKQFLAMCEAGWLIIAHRYDGSVDFNKVWESYKLGFGKVWKEHFIGFENILSLLQQKRYKARFDLTTWENETGYAEYHTFDINDEKYKYRINIDGYSGTAVSRAGKLESAIQLLIEKLKIDLKEDSSSIRDEIANLRDDVSNLRDDQSNLRDGQSDIRDNIFEMKKQLDEHTNDNIAKTDTDPKADDPVFSDGCNKSTTMFQTIQDQLKSFQQNCPKDEISVSRPVDDGEPCNNATLPVSEDCFGQSDGVLIILNKIGKPFLARCEAGWLIIAHRYDASVDFNLDWDYYKHGFGNIWKEHFIGLENIVSVLLQKRYKARFDLTTWENETGYAEYQTFDFNDKKDKYRITIDSYSGTAGDSMKYSNHMRFTTKDSDNDNYVGNCALVFGEPHWYDTCGNDVKGSIFGMYSKTPKCSKEKKEETVLCMYSSCRMLVVKHDALDTCSKDNCARKKNAFSGDYNCKKLNNFLTIVFWLFRFGTNHLHSLYGKSIE